MNCLKLRLFVLQALQLNTNVKQRRLFQSDVSVCDARLTCVNKHESLTSRRRTQTFLNRCLVNRTIKRVLFHLRSLSFISRAEHRLQKLKLWKSHVGVEAQILSRQINNNNNNFCSRLRAEVSKNDLSDALNVHPFTHRGHDVL